MHTFNVVGVGINEDVFRSAVATIIEDIQRCVKNREGKPLSLIDIAESIGVSLGTIGNAKNKNASLSAEFLARLGQKYGAAYLNPYFALFGAQAQPLPPKPTTDILPVLTCLTHDIAYARSPESPGGTTEVPQEKRAYLHKAKSLQREVGCLIREIEAA